MSARATRGNELAATDGRVRRGERSREQIVAALLSLIGDGTLQPTAQQVADRAAVGIRSVFRHFSEMDVLYAEMNAAVERDAVELLTGGDRSGPLAARIAGLVRQRAQLFERITPYKRAGNVQRWRSKFLQDRHQNMQRRLRADLQSWLPEVDGISAELCEALELATSFEAWERLRIDRRLRPAAATAVIERTVGALLRDRRSETPVSRRSR